MSDMVKYELNDEAIDNVSGAWIPLAFVGLLFTSATFGYKAGADRAARDNAVSKR